MPLLFQSESHGEIPFGFFNIETDMILLDNYFFFADDFAECMMKMASEGQDGSTKVGLAAYVLDIGSIGNLMGAISGVQLWGFIGDVYSRFPFPYEPEKFKQNPDGFKTRQLIENTIKKYSSPTEIVIESDKGGNHILIGDYSFSRDGFHALLQYLWVGGYPQWKDAKRPGYIMKMKEKIAGSGNPVFKGAEARMKP